LFKLFLHNALYIESDRDLQVIGTAKKGEEALSLIEKLNPDVALIDIEMPGELNGLDVSKIVSQSSSTTKILILTSYNEESYIKKALNTGAKGYLLKGTSAYDLIYTIKCLHKGFSQLGPGILEKSWGGKATINSNLQKTKLPNASSDRLLPTIYLDEFLPPQRGLIKIGGLSFTLIGAGLIFLSNILSFNMAVKVPAQIRPKGELKSVEATTSGIVERIQVNENDRVKPGEIIATVKTPELRAQKNKLEVQIDKLDDQINSTNLKINTINQQISSQQQASKQAIAALVADLKAAKRAYQNKRVETNADLEASNADVALATEELRRFRSLATTGAISQLQISEKEAALKSKIAFRRKSRVALNPNQGDITRLISKIEEAKAEKTESQSAIQGEKYSLKVELVELVKEKSRSQQELFSLEEQLSRNAIRTTFAGTIQTLLIRNQNQVVEKGAAIATLAVDDTLLRAETYIPSKDRSQVEPKQLVRLKIDSCPYPDYGTAEGKVASISPDVVAQSNSQNQDEADDKSTSNFTSYKVIIDLKNKVLQRRDKKQCVIKAGMMGEARIITKKETVLRFLLLKARLITDR
jgi:HlyD family secretion protein